MPRAKPPKPKVDAPPPAPAPEEKPKAKRGRPPKAEKQLGRKAEVDALVEAHMPRVWANLRKLADGETERVEEKWEPAGVIFRKDVAREKDGTVIRDKNQKPIMVEVLAFPDLPATELVLIEQKVIKLPADFKANEHIWNRFGGRPAEEDKGAEDDGLDAERALAEAHDLKDKYRDPDEEAAPDAPGP